MSIDLDVFFAVILKILFAAVLSVATGVGGCEWPIYSGTVLMDVAFWQFSNNPPNSDSMADAMTFLIMLHYTCTGPFYGGIYCIGVLDFGPRKTIHLLCFVPLCLICGMHPNICGESFYSFCILLLHLYVLRCNWKIDLSILRYIFLYFSLPPSVSLVLLTFWGIWL